MTTEDPSVETSTGEVAQVEDSTTEASNEPGESQKATKPRRPPPTGQELDNIGRKAKEQFAKQHQGATVALHTELRNHVVVRAYKRTFATVMRNWSIGTQIMRSALNDSNGANKLEQNLIEHLEKIKKTFSDNIKRLEHVLADNELANDPSLIVAFNPLREKVALLGPVAMRYREVLMSGDKLLDKATVAYTLGEIDSEEHEKVKFLVKRQLKSVDSLARNSRNLALRKSRDAGAARPNYKAEAEQTTSEELRAAA